MEQKFFILALLFGVFIGELTIRRGLIILRFCIPTTFRWYSKGKISSLAPLTRYIMALLFLSTLFIYVTWVVVTGYTDYIAPFLTGVAIMFVYGYAKSGETENNINNFVKYNLEYINNSELEDCKSNPDVENPQQDLTSEDHNKNNVS